MSLTPDQIAQQYPAFLPLLKIPEIAQLLTQAADPANNWSATQLQAHLYATNWWKTTSATARQWIVLELSDPAEAARQKSSAAQQYWNIAAQEGISLTFGQMGSILEQGLSSGWNAQQAQQAIVKYAKYGDPLAGGIDATQDALKATAADYGLSLSDQSLFDWAKKIQSGASTTDAFGAYAREQAKSLFPTLKDAIDSGLTVKQYADPYAQIASQTLGIDANTIDFRQAKWRAALQQRGHDGKLAPSSLTDWETKLMSDRQYGWDSTVNAEAAATNVIQGLESTFGKVAH